jgi:NAD(P)-dependent dehydrogenase (short-subunit alcohol dehydrogenase family)
MPTYGLLGTAEEVSDEQFERQIDTNVIGSIQVIRAALPHLRAQGGGRILQVSSEGGQVAYPHFSLYHTSKWAIEGFVEAVARETAPMNIEFTIVEPGGRQDGLRERHGQRAGHGRVRGHPVGRDASDNRDRRVRGTR